MYSCLKTPKMNQLRGNVKLFEACISPAVSSDKQMADTCLEAKKRQQMPSDAWQKVPSPSAIWGVHVTKVHPKRTNCYNALNQWSQIDICKPRNELIVSVHSEQSCCWSSPTAPKHTSPRALLTETTREL